MDDSTKEGLLKKFGITVGPDTREDGVCYLSVLAVLDFFIINELCWVWGINLKEDVSLGKDVSDSVNRLESKRRKEIDLEISRIRTVSADEKKKAYAIFGNIVRRWESEDSE